MVKPDRGSLTARRYLLGEVTEEECSAIEREYFGDEATVDRIAAVEENLVEDYLATRLTPDEHDRFERHYLMSPHHRTRVETIRRLSAETGRGQRRLRRAWPMTKPSSISRPYRSLAMAAALLISVGTVWMFVARHHNPAVSENRPAQPPTASEPVGAEPRVRPPVSAPPSATRVFAVSLSPVSVRSANDNPALIIPAGTDLVALRLEGEAERAPIPNARAVIRTVQGDEVWRGSATPIADLPAGVIARVDVPAPRLAVDDYILVLVGTDSKGVEQERDRYFLRVRSR
jgi:hypothetical protein